MIIEASLRESTKKKYAYYIKLWDEYLGGQHHSIVNIDAVLNFLSSLYDKGSSYSVVNSAKCAIATIVTIPPYTSLTHHPVLKKYMVGLFNLRPPTPKLGEVIWDVGILFKHIKSDNTSLSDKKITQKLLVLLLLLGGQRMNTIKAFHTDKMILTDMSVTFTPAYVLKHSKAGNKLDTFVYRAYHDKYLCVISCLREYLHRRKKKKGLNETQLFLTYGAPTRPASIDTMRRWVKELFKDCNIFEFSPHSCRSASTSKAAKINIDIEKILKVACWKTEQNFLKFYNREILTENVNDLNKIMDDAI